MGSTKQETTGQILINFPEEKEVRTLHIQYCAGFVDGEGCFHYVNGSTPQLTLTNTCVEVLYAMKQTFGCGRVCKQGKPKEGRKQAYQWYVTADKAIEVTKMLEPYLLEKQIQARCVMEARKVEKKYRTPYLVLLKALKH